MNVDANKVIDKLTTDFAIELANTKKENAILTIQVQDLLEKVQELEQKLEELNTNEDEGK